MERTEHVDTPVTAPVLFAVVEDLARYADWLDIVVAAIPDRGPARRRGPGLVGRAPGPDRPVGPVQAPAHGPGRPRRP